MIFQLVQNQFTHSIDLLFGLKPKFKDFLLLEDSKISIYIL